jgi:hypothetical protein
MIAEVRRLSGYRRSGRLSESSIARADELNRAVGCEHLLLLANSDSGESMMICVWRDQAAYDAFTKRRDELIDESEQDGGGIGAPQVFEVIYSS